MTDIIHNASRFRSVLGRYITTTNDDANDPKKYKTALEIYAVLNKFDKCKCTQCLLNQEYKR